MPQPSLCTNPFFIPVKTVLQHQTGDGFQMVLNTHLRKKLSRETKNLHPSLQKQRLILKNAIQSLPI